MKEGCEILYELPYRENWGCEGLASPIPFLALVPKDSFRTERCLNASWAGGANPLFSMSIVNSVKINRLRLQQDQFRSGFRKYFPVWRRQPCLACLQWVRSLWFWTSRKQVEQVSPRNVLGLADPAFGQQSGLDDLSGSSFFSTVF